MLSLWGLKALKVRGLGQGCVDIRYLTPYFGYTVSPHVDWPAQCLAQRKSQKKYTKRKDRKKIRDKNISSILSFIYWVKGLTNATSWDVAWCPKHQAAKWCCRFDGHCLKEREHFTPFIKRKFFLLFTHESSPFPLETSGSFFKFNSFLFIYLFIFF